ncbi:MAG: hypothetical protein ACR2O4_10485 [Hyphomicrobiaceae bacterium]
MTELKQLEETIAVYGSDPSRWPEGRAEALLAVRQSPDGAALLAEAAALEGTLDLAPGVSDDGHGALLARIMDATADTPSRTQPVDWRSVVRQRGMVAAGLLAASLMIGVFAGLNGVGSETVQDGLSVVQLNTTNEDELLADLTLSSEIDLEDEIL